jgi:hypothetical protein
MFAHKLADSSPRSQGESGLLNVKLARGGGRLWVTADEQSQDDSRLCSM